MRRNAVLAAILLAPAGAAAQDRPPTLPTRDVDVTYRSEQGGQVLEQRSRFDAAAQRMRLDTPTPGLYMIVDYRTRTMAMVSEADRGAVDMPAPPSLMPGAAAALVRGAPDQVAGLACMEWDGRDNQGQPVSTCFTADGVMLRARRGTQVLAQAVRVSYAVPDPSLFAVPAGYTHVTKRP